MVNSHHFKTDRRQVYLAQTFDCRERYFQNPPKLGFEPWSLPNQTTRPMPMILSWKGLHFWYHPFWDRIKDKAFPSLQFKVRNRSVWSGRKSRIPVWCTVNISRLIGVKFTLPRPLVAVKYIFKIPQNWGSNLGLCRTRRLGPDKLMTMVLSC